MRERETTTTAPSSDVARRDVDRRARAVGRDLPRALARRRRRRRVPSAGADDDADRRAPVLGEADHHGELAVSARRTRACRRAGRRTTRRRRSRSPRTRAGSLSSATMGTPGKRARQALAEERVRLAVGARDRIVLALVLDVERRRVDAHHERRAASRAAASATVGGARRVEAAHALDPHALERARDARERPRRAGTPGRCPPRARAPRAARPMRGPSTALETRSVRRARSGRPPRAGWHVAADEEASAPSCSTRRASSGLRPAVGAVVARREVAVLRPVAREQAVGEGRSREHAGAGDHDVAGEPVQVGRVQQVVGELDDLGPLAQRGARRPSTSPALTPQCAILPSVLSSSSVSTASPPCERVGARVVQEVDVDAVAPEAPQRALDRRRGGSAASKRLRGGAVVRSVPPLVTTTTSPRLGDARARGARSMRPRRTRRRCR